MRYVAIRHDASTHIRGRIMTDRNGKHQKRIRVGRGLISQQLTDKQLRPDH